MGFSQGACFVSLLCYLKEENKLKANFNFAIVIAGFKSGSVPHSEYYKNTISTPSLHVFGEKDQIIPPRMSADLCKCFLTFTIITHPGGHFVPASSNLKETVQKFLKPYYTSKQQPITST